MTAPTPANSNDPDADETGEDGRMSTVLERAEAAVADLAKNYASWALADVAKARAALAAATDDPGGRAEHVATLFRVGHDLKGQGASFGFPLITQIGHSLCALTRERAIEYRDEHLDLARSHIDAIDLVLTKGIKGDGGKVGAELVARLEQRVAALVG
jgi:chemotaxis protein histidine kinase CheA